MPEIERENILATRLEELQKYKDSQQLDMMYKMAGMGGDDEEEEEEDDEDERSRKRSECDLRVALRESKRTNHAFRKAHECDQRGFQGNEGPEDQAQSFGREDAKKGKSNRDLPMLSHDSRANVLLGGSTREET